MKRTKLHLLETCSTALVKLLEQIERIEDSTELDLPEPEKPDALDGIFKNLARDMKRPKLVSDSDDEDSDAEPEENAQLWQTRYEQRRPIHDSELAMLSARVDALIAEFNEAHASATKTTVRDNIMKTIRKYMERHGNVGPDFSEASRRNYKSLADVEFVHLAASYFLCHSKYTEMCKSNYSRIGAIKNAIEKFKVEFKEKSPLTRAFDAGSSAETPMPAACFEEIAEKIKAAVLYVEMESQKKPKE